MLRFVKQTVWLLALLIGCRSAFGFALIGPIPAGATSPDGFEQPVIAYALQGDLSTPKDIHDEYRRNTPVMYYACDESFWQYFGPEGVAAVDQAMAIYNSVGKTSAYSTELSEVPLDTRRVNFRARADGLWDLKSVVMGQMTEQLGFLEPTRWVWAIRTRTVLPPPPGAPGCPFNMEYTVFHRNFNIFPTGTDTYPTSSYVNGVLYSYFIDEVCAPPNPLADAIEFPVDPLSSPYSAVADYISQDYEGLSSGVFYTGLTRDDVGALKYLLATNNINSEAAGIQTTEFITNDVPTTIQTQDLNLFAQQARVNNAAALQALYPGLVITSTTTSFGLTITTNITQTLVNAPFDPAGTLPSHLIISTNFTTNAVTFFDHTFGNLVTNSFSTRGISAVITVSLSSAPFAPAGFTVTTNTILTARPLPVTGVFGDFFILPTNQCGAQVLSNLLTTITATTNLPTQITIGTTNAIVTFTPGSITFATNHLLVILPVDCPVDAVAHRGGMDRVQFVRRDFDSIVGRAWNPITNDYVLPELDETNSVIHLRHFQRRVARPDFLFSTADFALPATISYSNTVDGVTDVTGPSTFPGPTGAAVEWLRELPFNPTPRDANSAGPGTIVGIGPALGNVIIFNRLAPLFNNFSLTAGTTNSFLFPDETTQARLIAFGSFDSSTNAPVVYPNGTTIAELESLITGPQTSTPSLPAAPIGSAYSAQLTAVGGTPPYTWSLAPGSPGLPAGLNLSPSGQITGTPTGPAAIYDFTLRLTDSAAVFRDIQYTITVL